MAGKRERLGSRQAKQYARRTKSGRFSEVESVGRAAASDQTKKAKKTAKSGQGDKGDRKRSR